MSPINTYRDLVAWQKAMKLVTVVYETSTTFPSDERYGLTSQVRRAGVSIPSNIAEGYGRHSLQDYLRFLRMAMGSLFELQTQLEIAKNVQFMDAATYSMTEESTRETERILAGLIRSLEAK